MRHPRLKPIADQVVVVTGATSGIGLAIAETLSRRGARLFLVARNEDALRSLVERLEREGGSAGYAVADVADAAAVRAASDAAIARFGAYDTWVNDAGAFLYGAIADVPLQDQRRVFDVVYWGVVHGSTVAAEHLGHGGAIINIGSVLGEMAIPFQGPYCAAKFAVAGFTEALRREILAARRPIAVTLIKPAAIDTPFMEHARNRLGAAGTRNPPPSYDPQLVARAVLHASQHVMRDITVGGLGGGALVIANRLAPGLVDLVAARIGRLSQTTDDAGAPDRRDNLYEPREDLARRSTLRPFTRRTSLALEAQLHPVATVLAAGAVLALAGGALVGGALAGGALASRS